MFTEYGNWPVRCTAAHRRFWWKNSPVSRHLLVSVINGRNERNERSGRIRRSGRNERNGRSGRKAFIKLAAVLIYVGLLLSVLGGCSREQDPIKVGVAGTLTGPMSDMGVAVRNGAELALEKINEEGGINGRPLELLIMDDKNDPELIPALYASFLEEEVAAVIGHTFSNMSMAALPLINEQEIILVGPTNSSNALTGLDDFFFRVSQPTRMETDMHASFALQQGLSRMAVVYDLGNRAYSEDWLESFTAAYTAQGGTVTDTLTFEAGTGLSFSHLAEELHNTEGEAFLIIAGASDTAMICQQLSIKGSMIPRFTSSWAKTSELLQRGGDAIEGLYITHMYDKNYQGELYLKYREAYEERFRAEPIFGAAYGYDAMMALRDVLLNSSSHTAAELKKTFLELEYFQGLQGKFSMDEFGDPHRDYFFLFQVENNTFQRVKLNEGD